MFRCVEYAIFDILSRLMESSPESLQGDLLSRGVSEIIDRSSLERKLKRRRPLRVKYGIDPTGHDIHLGHAVPLRKLRAFQDAGHKAVLIIGDFTARIGDPTGRDTQRQALSPELARRYATTYLDQIGKIIDMKRAEVRYNSEWFDRLSPQEFLELIGPTSLKQLLAHDTFRRRLDGGNPLSVLEICYPMLQGYDSVKVEADVELGGLDQKFNLLMGREIQARFGQDVQEVLLTPYLTGLDGKQKMSKSLKNYIGIADAPDDIFGKAMSIPDKLMAEYFELATELPQSEISELVKSLKKKSTNPRDVKALLAQAMVSSFYGPEIAAASSSEFTEVFRKKSTPKDVPSAEVRRGEHQLLNILVSHQLVASRSEARRVIEQGGVRIDREVVSDWESSINIKSPTLIQVGKRKFLKLIPS